MANSDDIRWFKTEFGSQIRSALAGTPLSPDVLVAIACQETGYIWATLRRKNWATGEILKLCVGDVIDGDGSKGRKAFPINKAALVAYPQGDQMFAIARDALEQMAAHIPSYKTAAANPKKFCRGFGLFQSDLQFFKVDPDYFLSRRYEQFEATLGKAVDEIRRILQKTEFETATHLSEAQEAEIAIRYNTGGYNPAKQLKQGHQDSSGKFYGEHFLSYLRLSRTATLAAGANQTTGTALVAALLPPAEPLNASGPSYRVKVSGSLLNLRSAPNLEASNILAQLPDGHIVLATGGVGTKGFRAVQTILDGVALRGYVSIKFLTPVAGEALPAPTPAAAPPQAHLAASATTKITRKGTGRAYPLNEADAPRRLPGATPVELSLQLSAIVEWLAVDHPPHLRYLPVNGKTYCNIYAYDYCTLAGCYLPRVWWTGPALMKIAQGHQVAVKYGDTVTELRANDLFRWLRDFGQSFGWRRAASLDELQQEVNLGAVGLICARRKEDGRSGHIVAAVPEVGSNRARRDASGLVTSPLQSQAGSRNFRYGHGTTTWWLGEQFAESGFWLHA